MTVPSIDTQLHSNTGRSNVFTPDTRPQNDLPSAHTIEQSQAENENNPRNSYQACSIGLVIGSLIMGIVLAVILTIYFQNLHTTTTTTMITLTTTTTSSICSPFWQMPSSDQGTNLTYSNANTLISNDLSRSVCATFRANTTNADNIIFSLGSSLNSISGGCDHQWTLAIIDASHITMYGMCNSYDNYNIYVGSNILYDGSFHQICVSYDYTIAQLCVYLDLFSSSQCLTRTNPVYNTSLGDVRIGWWPDSNRQFVASGGGLIKLVSLFNTPINQSCVAYQYQMNNIG